MLRFDLLPARICAVGLAAAVGARLDRWPGRQGVEVRLLGSLDVRVDDQPVSLGGKKPRSVLVVLALAANRPVSTDVLIDEIWGPAANDGTLHALREHVSKLRKALDGVAGIDQTGPGYVLKIASDQIDLLRFERLVREGRAALGRGEVALGSSLLREALDLWRGPPLADFTYEPFASAHIERLEQERLATLGTRIDADLKLGRHAQVAPELHELVAENPQREDLRAQLVLALYRCDRQAEALNECKNGRKLLAEHLGIVPSSALQNLERAILDHDPAIDAPPFVPALDRPAEDSGLYRAPLDRETMPKLYWRGSAGVVVRELNAPLIRIGRGAKNEITIDDAPISRLHARIEEEAGNWRIVDLGSTNGTSVNQVALRPWQPHRLTDGAFIDLAGAVRMVFELTESRPGAATPRRLLAERGLRDRPRNRLSLLAAAFFMAIVNNAGSVIGNAIGSRVVEVIGLGGAGQSEQSVARVVQARFASHPEAVQEVMSAVDHDARNDPRLVASVEATHPELVRRFFGLSSQQAKAQKNRCPVGGEWMLMPRYFSGTGAPIRGRALISFSSMKQSMKQWSRSAYAQCSRGHRWPVFELTG